LILTDNSLRELFAQVERYVAPLVLSNPENTFSKEENRILALQQINRLNQKIGMIARSSKSDMVDMKALQTFVSSITIGVKSDNVPQIKYGLTQARYMISTLSKEHD
jgi:hypothetical protein